MLPNSNFGFNVGHHAPHAPYYLAQITADARFLDAANSRKRRIAFPLYTDLASVDACMDYVRVELARGNIVEWGVSVPTDLDDAGFTDYADFVRDTLVPFALALRSSRFCLSLGNEIEFHVNGTNFTAANSRQRVKQLAADVASVYGNITYNTSITFITDWATLGLGSIPIIGFNCYTRNARSARFQVGLIQQHFPANGYISECGPTGGFVAYGDDARYAALCRELREAYTSGAFDAYWFCYRGGSYGLPANRWELVLANDVKRPALFAVLGVRRPVVRRVVNRVFKPRNPRE